MFFLQYFYENPHCVVTIQHVQYLPATYLMQGGEGMFYTWAKGIEVD